MRKLSHEEIVSRQKYRMQAPFLPVTVVLNNIRSLYNVGSIFRTADGAGIEKIWLCGITGTPEQAGVKKTALGAEERVPWEHHPDAVDVVRQIKSKGYQIILLEQMEESISYHQFVPKPPVCLVIGNEIEGVSRELVDLCDLSVEIAMSGIKNSLNVSVAFGIIAYHLHHSIRNQD
jgi:tRNA G18 (ribose-2'-O)-methylase SpoU